MRSSRTGRPKSNSWFPRAAAATPIALNASTTDRPWNWLEISVPWKASPASMSSASPPRSRASRRMASIQPPSHSAPPTGSVVQAESDRGAAEASRAPCTSLIPTTTRRWGTLLGLCARFGCGAGAAQAVARSRVGKSAREAVMRGIVADRARDRSGRRSEKEGIDDSAVTRVPYSSLERRTRAALNRGDPRDDGSARPRPRRGREAGPVELDPLLRRPCGGDRGPLLPPVFLEAGRARRAALL